ncbi:hypothetical protein MQE23_42590 [Streptomyces sp. HP-A2021]|uniref:hypothetical protein n=1 Tax=Streptomyces sp. HP-A2021 TaxID=2927875 RepID=UPI001FAF9D3D|nr:hypothetical protein [Streptomyces sp. HP-A2021]UOB15333.1 hypothetical protein MQE23_42590 [Streptomyces sp. HP-A2021]
MIYRTHLAVPGALTTVLLATTPAVAATPGAAGPYTWIVEKGHLLACAGEEGGVRVSIDLYENSAFGTHAQVSVQTAQTEYLRGGETDGGLFNNGTISRRLVIEPQEETAGSSQTVLINGSYAPTGPRQWVHEVYDEPWGRVVSKGWKTPLSAAVAVNALGHQVDLTCEAAFAYDLKVRRPADSGS